MKGNPKRLIEVDLPIKRISEHARREKSIRHGHISTLHIWWARRPLAACRAVICAALWPDPADRVCPQKFRDEASRIVNEFARKAISDKKLADHCSRENWVKWQKLSSSGGLDPTKQAHWNVLRFALLDFIADFANWDNSTVAEYLETSRAITQAAHEALGGAPGTKPLVVDPFAGGGSIPLEALRIGADAFASDLNPVAVLLNKVLLEYIPKYGERLAAEVSKWGRWVGRRAENELAKFYPKDGDGSTPIAYLWARTIRCEGPGCGVTVPLLGSYWLSKRQANTAAIKLQTSGPGQPIKVQLVRNPKSVDKGLTSGNSATCPACGYTTPVTGVREQLRSRKGGSCDATMLAVVIQRDSISGKEFRLPNDRDLAIVQAVQNEINKFENLKAGNLPLIPDEQCPPEGALGFRFQKYGITRWRDLYSPRQLFALCTFARVVASEELHGLLTREVGSELASVVQIVLALAVGRLNDRLCTLCRWRPDKNNVEAANGGQNKMPMLLDFAESTPFGGSSGDWADHIEWIVRVLNHVSDSRITTGSAQEGPAQIPILPDDSAAALVTDPPYFDAFGYGDLSEFFHIWLRRAAPFGAVDLQSAGIPKREEAISIGKELADGRGLKNASTYSQEMTEAFKAAHQTVASDGIGVVVFANKTTAGWEAVLQGLMSADWIATASWPIDTELANRQRALGSAALNSSVHIVCRPRAKIYESQLAEEIGDWRDVLGELPKRIHEWMPRLAAEGVVGADAIFACIGPALEVFSKYGRVEKASGETVALKEYLEYVWAAVAKEALNMIFEGADATGFEEDARLTAMWLWTLSTGSNGAETANDSNGDYENEENADKKINGFVLEFDAARKIAQGLGAHLDQLTSLVEVSGDKARLLPVSERARHLFGKGEGATPSKRKGKPKQLSLLDTLEEIDQEEDGWGNKSGSRIGKTALDRIHQSMILFAAGRGEAVKRFLVNDGVGEDQRFWRLAQALSALYPKGTDERRWVEGVLARKKGLGF